MAKKSSKEIFVRSFVLLVVFMALLVVMSKIDVLTDYAEMVFSEDAFLASSSEAMAATDSIRNDYYNLIAGFWEHSSDSLNDRIELLDNGIIWRYTENNFVFPYGVNREIARVSHAYLMPMRFDDDNFALSNLRVIREVWFMPDTCFGNSFYDIVAKTSFRNDTLFFDNVPYTRFNGELKDFFPAGSLDLLGVNIDALRITSCRSKNVLADWLRSNVMFSFHGREIPFDALRFEQEQLLKNFYVPYSLSRAEGAMVFGNTYNLELRITISPNGRVENVVVRGRDFASRARRQPIIDEVKRWRFPTDGENSDTITFIGSFVKKQ